MSNVASSRGWFCTQCGSLKDNQLSLYRPGILNAHSRRLDPHCVTCSTSAVFRRGPWQGERRSAGSKGKVLIINGTCSTGKSTISYLLSEHYGFVQIDGDWIWQKAREQHPKIHSDELHEDLALLAESLVDLGKPVALAHIIPPEFLPVYQHILDSGGVGYRIVVLMPQMSTLLCRNESRKCWPKTTPEYWVRKFYEEFATATQDIQDCFYDNSDETEMETAMNLSRLIT